MDINTLTKKISEAVANNSTLDSWLAVQYSSGVSVFTNFDENNPPGQSDCPAVCVFPVRKKYAGPDCLDNIEIVCMLYDDNTREHVTIADITEYAATENIETFRQYVMTAIAGINLGNTMVKQVYCLYDTISNFPFVLVETELQFTTPYLIGSGNPLALE